jgi:PAS domain S-box-containing protein
MDLAEELGAAFLVSAGDVIISADTQGVIRFWNPGAERMFGYSSTEAIGRSLNLIVPEALRKRHWEGNEQVMRTGQSR